MRHITLRFAIGLFLVCILTSCVPSKKYNDLLARKTNLEKEFEAYKKEHKRNADQITSLNKEIDLLKEKISALEQDTSEIYHRYRKVKEAGDELAKRLNLMLAQQENQANTAISERQKLADQLTGKEKELDEKERALLAAETRLKIAQEELNKSKGNVEMSQQAITNAQTELEKAQKALLEKEQSIASLESDLKEREKRVNELENAIKAQEDKSNALRNKISQALLGFADTDLSVEQKNGKVYVSLSQDLLFASGSTSIDRKGKDALRKLAEVLLFNPDIAINVEGHTDNVPFRGRAGMKDNWDLSVLRSTSLVRELVKNGVDARRVTASGRGEYFPVADNETKDGKAKNRRSEIILTPKLDELYQIIQN